MHRYHQIVERDSNKFPTAWKAFHLSIFMLTAISGFISCFAFGRLTENFNFNCIINAEIVFRSAQIPHYSTTESGNSTISTDSPTNDSQIIEIIRPIDTGRTVWGPKYTCNFCQFTPIVSMISAIVWSTFFFILNKGGKGYESDLLPQPWKIVYPCILFCLIFGIVLLVSTVETMVGLGNFCDQLDDELDISDKRCSKALDVYSLQFNGRNVHFHDYYTLISVFGYIGMSCWFLQLLVLILRVMFSADFDMYVITIYEKGEEQVTNIITPKSSENFEVELENISNFS